MINCISSAMLAYFFTIPFHEFLHFLTFYIYGDKVEYASVQTVSFDKNGKQLGSPVRRNLIRTNGGRWYVRDYEIRF